MTIPLRFKNSFLVNSIPPYSFDGTNATSKRDLRRVKDWAENALVLPPNESLASIWSQGGSEAKIDLIKRYLFVVKDVDTFFTKLGSSFGWSLLAHQG